MSMSMSMSRFMRSAALLLLASIPLASAAAEASYGPESCRETSLARSTWPSDHGDSSRTKFTVGAGLPKGFDQKDVKVDLMP
jgi:hypothetical protein